MKTRMVASTALAVLVALPAWGQNAQTGGGAEQAEGGSAADSPSAGGQFIDAQKEGETRASNLIGKTVMNDAGEEIGEIEDLLLNEDQQMVGVVLSVGGFLGVAEKYVATATNQVEFGEHEEPATVQMSAEQLEGAPDFMTREQIEAAEQAAEVQRQQQEIMQQQQQQQQQLEEGTQRPAE